MREYEVALCLLVHLSLLQRRVSAVASRLQAVVVRSVGLAIYGRLHRKSVGSLEAVPFRSAPSTSKF
eukprot:5452906-Pleurochrysis_carterae.AAC.1